MSFHQPSTELTSRRTFRTRLVPVTPQDWRTLSVLTATLDRGANSAGVCRSSSRGGRLDHGRREGRDGRKQAGSGLARVLDQDLIHDDEARHCLNDGHRTRDDARVVTTASGEHASRAVVLSGLLSLRDRRRGFERDPV